MTGNSSFEKEKDKLIQEKCVQILTKLLKDEDNKYCVDCDGKSPRWASWNIGIFLCIRCAGIHRNLGVHISRVKSVNLDAWTPQQVACIEQMGNSRARAVYEANLPDTFRRPQDDSSLEKFIRSKYEGKKYIAREWVEPPMPKPTWHILIEKQLAKKRDKKSTGRINFPAPKTPTSKSKSASPKPLPKAPSKSSPNQIQKVTTTKLTSLEIGELKNSNLENLLELDTTTAADDSKSSDLFGDFLSAPMPTTLNIPSLKTNGDQISEEISFFNQKQPEISNEKLSKDSIMALYSKLPNQPQQPTLGGIRGLNSSLGQGNQNVSNRQQGFGGYQQNTMMMSQAATGNPIGSGMVHTQLFNHGTVSSTASPNMVPIVPVGFQLSAANPFSQMQSQMANMNMTGINSRSPKILGQNTNTQFIMPVPAPPYNLLEKNNSLAPNLWQ